MRPTSDQIETAAYHRWLRRGAAHGQDWEDWLAAEAELLFSLNYEVIARYVLDSPRGIALGCGRPARCRFCERGIRGGDSGAPVPVVPAALGNTALASAEVCRDCRAEVLEPLASEFLRFARPFVSGSVPLAAARRVPMPAYKGLIAVALLVLPEPELEFVEDTAEWVANPDHELDSGVISRPEYRLRIVPNETRRPWVAVARRADPDAALPYLVFSLGSGQAVFQAPLPLCTIDDELDGAPIAVPHACCAP